MKISKALTILMLGSMTFATHAAVASTQDADTAAVEVQYDDLNLSNANGAATIQRRIRQAADRACGGRVSRELGRVAEYQRCTLNATTKALAAIEQVKSSRS